MRIRVVLIFILELSLSVMIPDFFEMLLTLKAVTKSFSIGVVHSEEIPWQVGTSQ